jgi:hypothetical protein
MTEKEYLASLKAHTYPSDGDLVGDYERRKNLAFKIAKTRAGWEGDFSQGPYYSGVPAEGGNNYCSVLIGWKQPNNGTTFVASEYKLPWLEKDWPSVKG